jgi:hypothetical protein
MAAIDPFIHGVWLGSWQELKLFPTAANATAVPLSVHYGKKNVG